MTSNPGGISQSNTGQMSGGMQAAIGNNNQQNMQAQTVPAQKTLSQEDVLRLLGEIQQILQGSTLPEDIKQKASNRLGAAVDEVQQKEPDKQLAAGNLKRMTETLEDASKTLNAGQGLVEKVQPILGQLLGWLNVAKSFFGL
ncbi:hypothetical protein FNW02_24645 [Komarekiella sp. 'clone 1']|jgi:hypothetical protein|uniref:Uncharacterized protein n=1 Tax=Komarekiella delphini-convector SJRDD-AB1 TaxID=2593771 RepID=A0AA40T1H3_9NOST|nr:MULTISPECIES: hypothetical protein [Nostocaceae]MBD6618924.1 hypothetical protein [Komarekiella delphini-convector SJRDD-AB1]